MSSLSHGSKGVAPLDGNSRAAEARRFTRGRLTLVLVPLAVIALLVTYAVTNRPSASTTVITTATTIRAQPSGQVLLNATFDDGQLDPAVWNTCHWWADKGCTIASNDELEWYVPEQVSVSEGALQLTADRAPVRGSDGRSYDFRSGMVTTGPPPMTEDAPAKLAFAYGSVEARLRVPAGPRPLARAVAAAGKSRVAPRDRPPRGHRSGAEQGAHAPASEGIGQVTQQGIHGTGTEPGR
jgi:hypothetical protein